VKITAVSISNFKRLEQVEIVPAADRELVLIAGKNAQGKSSILDALTAAFGGKRQQPTDPVRHGADEAEVFLELDDGLSIRRAIRADGSGTLEVRDRNGTVRSPQALLDKLVGTRFLDPLAFLQLPAKEQRATLMKLIPDAARIDELDIKRVRAFERRTEIGRELTKAEGELERLKPLPVGEAIDVAKLTAEERAIADERRKVDQLEAAAEKTRGEAEAVDHRRQINDHAISKLEAELAALRNQRTAIEAELATAEARAAAANDAWGHARGNWEATEERRDKVAGELARAGEHNRAVFEAEAHNKRRAEAEAAVAKHTTERDELTKVLKTIDERKAKVLAAAKLPVPGLAVGDDGVLLNDVPFAQASGAERLRVALALAGAASPGLDDVWIRDGALLDEDSLVALAELAKGAGKRFWIERVGTADPGAIVIQDGKVAS
jgi:chromosome segregation ATPase